MGRAGVGGGRRAGFRAGLPGAGAGAGELALPTQLLVWAEALGCSDAALSAKGLDSLISRGSVPCGGA